MTALKIILLGCVAALTIGATEDSEVAYPDGFRGWTHVTSSYVSEGHPSFPKYSGIHHIYANKPAMIGYRSGEYPIGSVIAFDLRAPKASPGSVQSGARALIDVMEKRQGGWRFIEFLGDNRVDAAINGEQGVKRCAGCHTKAKRGGVFSRVDD
ncbi:hypothetical protein ACVWZA_003947 [Sphingomonas sp. UYAg733]